LAPLDDVTDTVFRRIVQSCAKPDLMFTEFTNVDALQSAGRKATLRRLDFTEAEKPIIAQIWGKTPENFYKTAKECLEKGFAGIDLNFGCPIKHVVKNGCCAALISNHQAAKDIIDATKQGVKAPKELQKMNDRSKSVTDVSISVKTRIGLKDFDNSWLEFLLRQKLDMLIIHLRTVREMSKVPAHWELMDKIKKMRDEISPKTLLVANGDVQNRTQADFLAKKHRLDGVMIGRGVFSDPYAFAKKSPWPKMPAKKKIALYKKHVELFASTWENNERPIVTLNKFCKIYINGFDGAKEMREQLMACKSAEELLGRLSA